MVGEREGLLPECSAGCLELRRLKLKHTWQLTACLLHIINGSLPTGSTISITMVVKRLRVRTVRAMPKCQKFSSCHDFSVYVYVVTLTVAVLAVGICMRYLAISGEDWHQHIYLCVTNPALCIVNQCAARSGSPRDDKSSH